MIERGEAWRPFHERWGQPVKKAQAGARGPARVAPKPSKKLLASALKAMELAGGAVSTVDLKTAFDLRMLLPVSTGATARILELSVELNQLGVTVQRLEREIQALKAQANARASAIAEAQRAQFRSLATSWREETMFLSSTTDRVTHWAYQRIIGLGHQAVRFILEDLSREPGHWFWALNAITGADPVAPSDRGNVQAMTAAWLAWGHQNKFDSVG